VLLLNAMDRLSLETLLERYGLALRLVAPQEVIPGSYWGEREAGLIGSKIFARLDTPLHSVLHESAHFICMTPERRAGLDTDAGGDDAEESAVCYLQILLAEALRPRSAAVGEGWVVYLGSAKTSSGSSPAGPASTAAASSSSGSSSSSSSSTGPDNELNGNDFITLLAAQLQAQDPLNPIDPTTFVTQLVQFNQLEQLININQTLSGATGATTSSATQSMQANQANQANQLAATAAFASAAASQAL